MRYSEFLEFLKSNSLINIEGVRKLENLPAKGEFKYSSLDEDIYNRKTSTIYNVAIIEPMKEINIRYFFLTLKIENYFSYEKEKNYFGNAKGFEYILISAVLDMYDVQNIRIDRNFGLLEL
jgi:hypothetical protein